MKNYSAMSDFEINCAVAKALAFEPIMFFDVDASFCHGPVWNVVSGMSEEGIVIRKGCAFLPCSSWADAGPVIESSLISIDSIYDGKPKWLSFAGEDSEFRFVDKKPLRAAMIVFLMMQEVS